MAEPDYTDDWMNPEPMVAYVHKKPENKVEYRILRQRSMVVSGPSGRLTEWRVWSTHDTAKERDLELERLHKEHPAWRLKRGRGNPHMEAMGFYENEDGELIEALIERMYSNG